MTVFGRSLSESIGFAESKNIPFSYMKQFLTKMNTSENDQMKIAEDCKLLYREHPDYIVTDKEISELLPNMKVEPNSRALKVFGISYVEPVKDAANALDLENARPEPVKKPEPAKKSKGKNSKAVQDAAPPKPKKNYRLVPLVFIHAVLLNTCNEIEFDEKIKFQFSMVDDNEDGVMSRQEVFKLLSYQNEENGFGLQDAILEEMVETVFEEIDKDGGGTIDFDEFKAFFSRFKGIDIAISASSKRNASVSDGPKTLESGHRDSRLARFKHKMSLEGTKWFWMFCYVVGLAITAWWYFTTYYKGILARGIAKMFAGMVSYNLALIVGSINKSIISFLRVIPFFTRVVPVNKNIVFHKHMAVMMLVCAIGHAGAHLFGTFRLISSTPIEILNSEVLHSPMPATPSYARLLFATVPGITGILLMLGFILMMLLARKPIKTANHELFWYSHHLYIAMLILLHIHGMKEYVASQTYWKWVIGPIGFLVSEKLIKFYQAIIYRYKIEKLKVNSGVIELEIRRPRNFMYVAGQYACLNVPQISKLQWHPFTISSCPRDGTINFHIAPVGWWTKKLAQIAKDYDTKKIKELPTIRIDGPWGAPAQHYEEFKHVMFIGAGIGATPFCSILREILDRMRRKDTKIKFKEIDFFWVNRGVQNTKWLNKVLLDLKKESQDIGGFKLNLYIFYTGAYEKYDFRSFMLWNGFQFMKDKGRLTSEKMANYDCMHWGRPDWNDAFSNVTKRYEGKNVGVFICAAKVLCHEIHDMCLKYSDKTNFHYFKENFG